MPASPSSRPGRRPDPALHTLWAQRLHSFEQSGLSATSFCKQHRLSLPSFYAWRRRLRPATSTPEPASHPFVPIHLLPAAPAVELVLPSGAVLRLSPGCDLAFVRSLLDTLGGGTC